MQQPQVTMVQHVQYQQGVPQAQWQHGTFGCFDNIGICVVTYFLPCYTFGKNAEALGEDCCACCFLYACCPGISFGAEVALRQKLRMMRNIEGSLTRDILLVMCCGVCSLCQEASEIRAMQGGRMAIERA